MRIYNVWVCVEREKPVTACAVPTVTTLIAIHDVSKGSDLRRRRRRRRFISMLNIRMPRTPIEGSPVSGCLIYNWKVGTSILV